MTSEIAITLTSRQVRRVVRQASAHGVSIGLDPLRLEESAPALAPLSANPNYSGSLIRAVLVLAALPADGSMQELTATARALDLSMSTVHRYLQTWLALGVVEQEPDSRRYRRSPPSSRPQEQQGT